MFKLTPTHVAVALACALASASAHDHNSNSSGSRGAEAAIAAPFRACDEPAGHGIVLWSLDPQCALDSFYASHLGGLVCPHQFDLKVRLQVSEAVAKLACAERAQGRPFVSMNPPYRAPNFWSEWAGVEWTAPLLRGALGEEIMAHASVKVHSIIFHHEYGLIHHPHLVYLLWPAGQGRFHLHHYNSGEGDWDQILTVNVTDAQGVPLQWPKGRAYAMAVHLKREGGHHVHNDYDKRVTAASAGSYSFFLQRFSNADGSGLQPIRIGVEGQIYPAATSTGQRPFESIMCKLSDSWPMWHVCEA